ncbi:MAG: nucleotidyltransferase domain-containing protein [Bacteroidota bacterium]|nr:nucleotidyltransferase domain-containing protein [Bacteroidota bacterium]
MRLLKKEIEIVKSVILGLIPDAEVYIFGSKIYDIAKGGDIDILVISENEIPVENILTIKVLLKENLGDQKIDLVCQKADNLSPFAELIKMEGVHI